MKVSMISPIFGNKPISESEQKPKTVSALFTEEGTKVKSAFKDHKKDANKNNSVPIFMADHPPENLIKLHPDKSMQHITSIWKMSQKLNHEDMVGFRDQITPIYGMLTSALMEITKMDTMSKANQTMQDVISIMSSVSFEKEKKKLFFKEEAREQAERIKLSFSSKIEDVKAAMYSAMNSILPLRMEVTVLREAIVNAETILRDVPENCIAAMEYFIESNPSHHNVDAVRMQMTEIRQSMLMIESAKQSIKNAADAREVLLKNIDRLHQIAIPTWTLQFSVFVTTVESSSANVASLEDAISSLVNVTNTFVNSIGNKS